MHMSSTYPGYTNDCNNENAFHKGPVDSIHFAGQTHVHGDLSLFISDISRSQAYFYLCIDTTKLVFTALLLRVHSTSSIELTSLLEYRVAANPAMSRRGQEKGVFALCQQLPLISDRCKVLHWVYYNWQAFFSTFSSINSSFLQNIEVWSLTQLSNAAKVRKFQQQLPKRQQHHGQTSPRSRQMSSG